MKFFRGLYLFEQLEAYSAQRISGGTMPRVFPTSPPGTGRKRERLFHTLRLERSQMLRVNALAIKTFNYRVDGGSLYSLKAVRVEEGSLKKEWGTSTRGTTVQW